MFRPAQPGDWGDSDDENDFKIAAATVKKTNAWGDPNANSTGGSPVVKAEEEDPTPKEAIVEKKSSSAPRLMNRSKSPAAAAARGGGGSQFDRSRPEKSYRQSSSSNYHHHHRSRSPRGQGGRFDRSSRFEPRQRRFREKEIDLPKDQGFVRSLKENFGFIECLNRDEDLFFHCSQAPDSISIGDEVEFSISENRRSGQDNAVQLIRLDKGTIQIEDIDPNVSKGTVIRNIPRSNYYNSRNVPNEGMIQSQDKRISFTADVCEAGLPTFDDDVEFQIAVHKKTLKKRALKLKILQTGREKQQKEIEALIQEQEPETGLVVGVKSSGGQIKCCDRNETLYFALNQIQGKERVREKDEVSFYPLALSKNNSGNELTACRIEILKKGTISFTTVLDSKVKGVVVSKSTVRREDSEEKLGFVAKGETHLLQPGDIVSFDVVMNKRSKEKEARKVELIQYNPENRQKGIVSAVIKSEFGFIKSPALDSDVYFRLDDISGPVRKGTNVEFNIETSDDKKNQRASRISILPYGTVTFDTIVYSRLQGVLLQKGKIEIQPTASYLSHLPQLLESVVKNSKSQYRDREKAAVQLHCDLSSDLTFEQGKILQQPHEPKTPRVLIDFSTSALEDPRYRMKKGDLVECDVVLNRESMTLRAEKIVFKERKESEIETGVITHLRPEFGFVYSLSRQATVYFLRKRVRLPLQIQDEVSFQVETNERSKKEVAVHFQKLEKGSLPLEQELLDERQTGTIVHVATKHRVGEIQLEESKATFKINDRRDRAVVLRPGDVVECQVMLVKLENVEFRASDIVLLESKALSGVVESINSQNGGVITIDETKTIPFQMRNLLSKQTVLQPGDGVEFSIYVDSKTQHETAANIVQVSSNSSVSTRVKKSMLPKTMNRSRMAKGPDGSRGFTRDTE